MALDAAVQGSAGRGNAGQCWETGKSSRRTLTNDPALAVEERELGEAVIDLLVGIEVGKRLGRPRTPAIRSLQEGPAVAHDPPLLWVLGVEIDVEENRRRLRDDRQVDRRPRDGLSCKRGRGLCERSQRTKRHGAASRAPLLQQRPAADAGGLIILGAHPHDGG